MGAKGLDDIAAYLANLSVSDRFRRQGLGSKIIEWAITEARKAGKQCLRLDCPASNAKLCEYYEKQGFDQVAVSSSGNALYERAL